MKKDRHNIQVLDPRSIGERIKKKLPPHLRSDIHDFKEPNIFIITKIEESAPYMEFPIKLHRRDQFELICVTEGYTIRTKGLHAYEIHKNSLFLLPPHQITSTEFVSPDCKGYYCMFDAAFYCSCFKETNCLDRFPFFQMDSSPLIQLTDTTIGDILFLLNKLHTEFLEGRENKQDFTATLVRAILLEAAKHDTTSILTPSMGPVVPSKLVRQYKNLLNRYFLTKQTVREYADMLFVSPNHLNKCVKQVLGKTAGTLILEMQLLEAKMLLKESDLSVSQIASHLGFNDNSYFSRFFKKSTGMTPLAYRKT